MKPKVISLFSGCGGFDIGLENAGAETVFVCDIFKDALDSLKNYMPQVEVYHGDIRKREHFPEADIVIGGYPCQGFSLAGKRIVTDPRNFLYKEFVRVLSVVRPKFFIAENVKGLLTMDKGKVIEAMVSEFAEQGYKVQYKLYNSKHVGVPQDRERVFIVGVRTDLDYTYEFPEETHGEGKLPIVTLRDAISHLTADPIGEYDTSGYSPRFLSRNRKRGWDEPSFTIQASGRHAPFHPSGEPMEKVGKDQWRLQGDVNRKLSYRECGLIQTFPEDFEFKGVLGNKYKMIGNAVPPLLAKHIADPIVTYLKNHT